MKPLVKCLVRYNGGLLDGSFRIAQLPAKEAIKGHTIREKGIKNTLTVMEVHGSLPDEETEKKVTVAQHTYLGWADDGRNKFTNALLKLDEADQKVQIRQMVLDIMDVVEQGPLEPLLIETYDKIQKDWFTE